MFDLRAITRRIEGMDLALEGTFRVVLHAANDYDHVRGNISVYAVDGADVRTLIARRTFLPPTGVVLPVHALPGPIATPPEDWRNATLETQAPSWMPRTGDLFRLPSGFRLALEVDLDGGTVGAGGRTFYTPIVYELGRDDVRTALHVRHATPGAFASFAYEAEPILPGTHTGSFATPFDADVYAFTATAGALIDLTSWGANATLYDPDGRAKYGPSLRAGPMAGTWIVRLRDPLHLPSQEYGFVLSLHTPPEDPEEGTFLEQGWLNGSMGEGDDSDTIRVFAWKAQRFTLRLEFPSDASFRFYPTLSGWEKSTETGPGYTVYRARQGTTGYFDVRIDRVYGEGSYALGYFPDPAGNLTQVPWVQTLVSGEGPITDLVPIDAGVFFVNTLGTWHLTPESRTLVSSERIPIMGVSAEGEIVRPDRTPGAEALAITAGGALNPLVRGASSSAGNARFGPDGLYVVDGFNVPRRVLGDRSIQTFGTAGPWVGVFAAPDGTMYAHDQWRTAFRFDLASGRLVRETSMDYVQAFDVEGGRYRVLSTTLLERIDPTTGQATTVAQAEGRILRAVAAGPNLYVVVEQGGAQTLAHIEMPTWGFDGFEPSFAPPMPPDLVIEGVRESVELELAPPGQTKRFDVTIRNDGGSAARAFNVSLHIRRANGLDDLYALRSVALLPAGANATVVFEWRYAAAAGDRVVDIIVDPLPPSDSVVESNESNNRVRTTSYAWVGGNDAICREVLGPFPLPPSIVGGDGTASSACGSFT